MTAVGCAPRRLACRHVVRAPGFLMNTGGTLRKVSGIFNAFDGGAFERLVRVG